MKLRYLLSKVNLKQAWVTPSPHIDEQYFAFLFFSMDCFDHETDSSMSFPIQIVKFEKKINGSHGMKAWNCGGEICVKTLENNGSAD